LGVLRYYKSHLSLSDQGQSAYLRRLSAVYLQMFILIRHNLRRDCYQLYRKYQFMGFTG